MPSPILETRDLTVRFGAHVAVDAVSCGFHAGELTAIVGPNGAGKTTLVKLLIGELAPDGGELRQGTNLEVAWFDQTRSQLDPDSTPWDVIGEGTDRVEVAGATRHVVGYLKDFMFDERQTRGKIKTLSGGERNRVHMAKLLRSGGNVLLLDEPTNDLDVETLRALEDALLEFAGCAVVISHDRWFLDRICTHMLAFEGDSHVEWFEGNFEDYEKDKIRRLGADAAEPKRIKYKKFSR